MSTGLAAAEGLGDPEKWGAEVGTAGVPLPGAAWGWAGAELGGGRATFHLQAASFKSAGRGTTCFLTGSWKSCLSAQMSLGDLGGRHQR